jgi:hypothetical protein
MKGDDFRNAPVMPAQAANIILRGVKDEQWRILVGKDAAALDRAVRMAPVEACDPDFAELLKAEWED